MGNPGSLRSSLYFLKFNREMMTRNELIIRLIILAMGTIIIIFLLSS
jgi:hypothetical protein